MTQGQSKSFVRQVAECLEQAMMPHHYKLVFRQLSNSLYNKSADIKKVSKSKRKW